METTLHYRLKVLLGSVGAGSRSGEAEAERQADEAIGNSFQRLRTFISTFAQVGWSRWRVSENKIEQ